MNNLLEQLALAGTQVTRLGGELHPGTHSGGQIQAHVEIKLNPVFAEDESEQAAGHFQVACVFKCVGRQRQADGSSQDLFSVDCVLNAAYRQMAGDAISREEFIASHTSLGRQLYPLARQVVMPLLSQLGYASVQLPLDLFQASQATTAVPESSSEPPSLH